MDEEKKAHKSVGIWGNILVFVPVLDMLRQALEGLPAGILPIQVQAGLAAIGAALGIYGRMTATKEIKGL